MPEARFLKIIIVALLLLNLGTLGFLWLGGADRHQHPPPPPGGRGRGAGAFLREELQLSDAQETAYRKMRDAHHETMLRIRDEMKETKRQLYGGMQSGDTTAAQQKEGVFADSLAAQQRRIEIITYNHFRELRALCTPQQQKKFDAVIGEALEQMH